ncbi:hypothetical protein [Streptomyces sp. GC420]|nr:hypothetical protein [Streptomyces sp. GC420]NBM15321.1 hypothetical protein [Streptomyces sp. GC420]
MVRIGYTMMTEQAGPRALLDHVVRAEEAVGVALARGVGGDETSCPTRPP